MLGSETQSSVIKVCLPAVGQWILRFILWYKKILSIIQRVDSRTIFPVQVGKNHFVTEADSHVSRQEWKRVASKVPSRHTFVTKKTKHCNSSALC